MGPAARLLLQRAGLSADDIRPTGPNGIITKVHQMTLSHMQDLSAETCARLGGCATCATSGSCEVMKTLLGQGDVLAAMEGGAKPAQKPTQKHASASPSAGEPAAEQQSQKQPQATAGRAEPAKAAQPKQQQQQQQQPAQQQQEGVPRRPQVPDSYLRALLANQMLEKGEPIPARWLRDWVGITEDKQQAVQQE